MSVLNQLASAQVRRDEAPNLDLFERLAAAGPEAAASDIWPHVDACGRLPRTVPSSPRTGASACWPTLNPPPAGALKK